MTAIDWQTTDPIPEDMPILSFGGGRNSVYLYYLMEQEGQPFIALFSDPGAEKEETYAYIRWMHENSHPVTVIEGRDKGMNIIDYCRHYNVIPSRTHRWCTHRLKIEPMFRWLRARGRTDVDFIGIAYEERHRCQKILAYRPDIRFPLVERQITTADCLTGIAAAGWPIPVKSGCWFCPEQQVGEWERLGQEHPAKLALAAKLEDAANAARVGAPFYLGQHVPVRVAASGPEARRLWRRQQKGQINFMEEIGLDPCPFCHL